MKFRKPLVIGGSVVGILMLGVAALCAWRIDRDDGSSIAAIVRRLKDETTTRRRDAASSLGQVVGPGASHAAESLIAALGDVDPHVRARSARSLGVLVAANPDQPIINTAVGSLTAALNDRVMLVRLAAAIGLQSLGREAESTFAIAIDAFRDDEPSLQADATALLAIRDAESLRRALVLLDDPAPSVRRSVEILLTHQTSTLQAEFAMDVLASALRDGSVPVREVAATMLGRSVIPMIAGRDLLMLALNDPVPSVRLAASSAMGTYAEDPIARFALQLAADDPDLRVRVTSSASLALGRRAARAEALADLKIAIRHDPARSGLAAMIETDPDRATPILLEALLAPDPRLRAAAARCLGEVVSKTDMTSSIVESLIQSLADRAPFVRRAAAASLARYGPDALIALDALKRASRDPDRSVSTRAFLTLRGLEESQVR